MAFFCSSCIFSWFAKRPCPEKPSADIEPALEMLLSTLHGSKGRSAAESHPKMYKNNVYLAVGLYGNKRWIHQL